MITSNSVSGGKTSGYIAVHYPADYNIFSLVCIDDKECAPEDKKMVQWINDKLGNDIITRFGEFIATAEDDATLYALRDLEQIIGTAITWVRGVSFDDLIDYGDEVTKARRTRLPSWARRYCTECMKMIPIFEWWMRTIGEKVEMRIGFRSDEFNRMIKFFNGSNRSEFKYPVSCSTRGQRFQKYDTFNWRYCTMPLIKDQIDSEQVKKYWQKNGWLGGNLFEEKRKIVFPEISNCIGCFHKKPETLSIMSVLHPSKMRWFARQEHKHKGTWLDSKITYDTIIANSETWIPEMLKESGAVCDSGGCTD